MEDRPIVWQPNPGPQTWALQKVEKEILYGGARGGGKTDAGMVWLAEPVKFPFYRGLVLRRNAIDLADWIARAKVLYRNLGGVYTSGVFKFPGGAEILTGHLQDENAYEKYQGHEYQRIVIEELTHIPNEELFLKVLGSNRSTHPDLPAQFFGTTNPGGVGHRWVKTRYVDTCRMVQRKYTDEDGREITVETGVTYIDPATGLTRIFVPAKVEDNPKLFKNDPNYVAYLESLPEDLRQAWRHGSWDSYEVKGAYYTAEMRQMRNEGRITKVPHDENAMVHTWWDLGKPENTSIGFFQQIGMEWHLIDFYTGDQEGGVGGIKHYIKVLKQKENELGYLYGKHWAPHDIEQTEFSTGMSRREYAKRQGIHFHLAPKYSFDDGIDAVRRMINRLWIDETNGQYLIDALLNYKKKWNNRLGQFEANDEHDWSSHPSDMIRYWAVTNMPPQKKQSLLAQRKQQQEEDANFDPYAMFK